MAMRIYLQVRYGAFPPSIICSPTIGFLGFYTNALWNSYPFINPYGIHLL